MRATILTWLDDLETHCRADLDAPEIKKKSLLASACKAVLKDSTRSRLAYTVEGVGDTPGVVVLQSGRAPRRVTLAGKPLEQFEYSLKKLVWG